MKLVSLYLPQFHEIPENNNAWGEGFTEWVNVKKTTPLFVGHRQPRVPLDGRYYNLLDPETWTWQVSLANTYGIDAFCLYHYWFNGRMVLEKPVELLRQNRELSIQYCFAWANEPWTKTWHGAGGQKEILIPQTYGGEAEWEAHYQYFLPYFQDPRYLKKDNRPVLLILRLHHIPNYNDMIRYWKRRAVEDGFAGIHLLCMADARSLAYRSKWVDGTVDFEPNKTKSEKLAEPVRKMRPNGQRKWLWNRFAMKNIPYREINRRMLAAPHGENEYRTVFVDYDDTPRRGMRGVVTLGSSPARFGQYLRKNLCLAQKEGQEFLFINAWNEWGEGNYLEPDTDYKYAYLEEVKAARAAFDDREDL